MILEVQPLNHFMNAAQFLTPAVFIYGLVSWCSAVHMRHERQETDSANTSVRTLF